MTFTAVSSASSHVDQHQSSYALGSLSKSQDRSDSFAHILNEGLRKENEGSGAKSSAHEKTLKADSQPNDKVANVGGLPERQNAKPALTGKLGSASQQQTLTNEQPLTSEQQGLASQQQTLPSQQQALTSQQLEDQKNLPATQPSPLVPVVKGTASLSDEVLAGNAVDTSSGSAIMSILMRLKTGSTGIPSLFNAKAFSAKVNERQDQQNLDQQPATMLPSNLLAIPLLTPTLETQSAGQTVKTPDSIASGSSGASAKSQVAGSAVEAEKGEAATAALPSHTAFALRLNADNDASNPQGSAPENVNKLQEIAVENVASTNVSSVTSQQALSVSALAASAEKKEHSHSDSNDQAASSSSAAIPLSNTFALPDAAPPATEPAAATSVPEVDDKSLEYSTETVRNVQVQLLGEDKRRVELRMMDRSGELRVSVKSGDASLNESLQGSMPELTTRLQAARYKTEVWLPTLGAQSQSPGEDTEGADGSAGRQQRPNWVADLDGVTH